MKKNFEMNMCEGKIFGKLIVYALPLVLTNVLQLLFNAADVAVLGIFVSDDAVAAVGATGALINLIIGLFVGLSVGANVLVARFSGEQKVDSAHKTVGTSVIVSLLTGVILAFIGCAIMYLGRWHIGTLFGSSDAVNIEIAKIIPIFLISVPFVAITRISTAGFYATEKAVLSYILTFIEPVLMLVLMLILPPLLGGQIMIWWSTVFARIISALLALLLTKSNKEFSAL